jgi:hypothetical protein
MKPSQKIIWTCVLGVFLYSATPVEAMPRLWRKACGTVDRMYSSKKLFVLITDDKNRVLLVSWKKRTRVYRDGERVEEVDIKEGDHLCLHYRSPLFGERWTTKILLTQSTHRLEQSDESSK